ncbi:MAG TPA: dTDP-4-dehydrorhamnose reductase [Verrucomicrobiales bacterium]|nr:dTDP-4-dehydrorhamnose reductase [Verrucomicrobiales bacterium]
MILLLGATGYIGSAFAAELASRGVAHRPVSRAEVDYTRFDALLGLLREARPSFLINAAGYTGKPNVDACETHRAETLAGNTLLPQTIAHACAAVGLPWGHVSSGCIYNGAKLRSGTGVVAIPDLTAAAVRPLVETRSPDLLGFTEEDSPNFSFRSPPCSFYSGSKALGEEGVAATGAAYVWRLRIPFDEVDGPRNYLSKIQRYPRVYDNANSISHRRDFVRACLDLWERRAPFAIYNVTNPGYVTTRQVVQAIERVLRPGRRFEFWENDAEFYRLAARTPRSNCLMDVSRLLSTGVRIRPVEEALEESLRTWRPEPPATPSAG